jgi:hypothetical protein
LFNLVQLWGVNSVCDARNVPQLQLGNYQLCVLL